MPRPRLKQWIADAVRTTWARNRSLYAKQVLGAVEDKYG